MFQHPVYSKSTTAYDDPVGIAGMLVLLYILTGFFYSMKALWRDDYYITLSQWTFRCVFWWAAIPYDTAVYIIHKRRLCRKLAAVLPRRMSKNLFWKHLHILYDMESALCKKTDMRVGKRRMFWRQESRRNSWVAAQPTNGGAARPVRVSPKLLFGRTMPSENRLGKICIGAKDD